MADNWCNVCGGFSLYPDNHTCPPQWWVWEEDGHERDDGRWVRAVAPEYAAEEFAEEWDAEDGDYPILSEGEDGEGRIFLVASHPTEDEPKRFSVKGWSEPTYSAEPLDPDEDDEG